MASAATPPLTTLEYKITGTQLRVTPTVLSVPKGIAGSVMPAIVAGASTNVAAVPELTQGAYIEATLRGPSFDARRVLGRPNEAMLLPPLNLVGDYQLDNIRLVDAATGATRLEGVPSSVSVRVFDEVLVSRVTSRPLTVDEIKEKGIFIDEQNFRAVEFEVRFVLDGQTIPIKFPVVAPSFSQSTEIIPAAELEARLVQAALINQQIASEIATVPPAFEAAGIELQVQGINFQIVEESDIDLALSIPPIPALMVIPGNIGFLSQFFSVQIFTENAAPLNSGLSVNHVMAKLNLPPGPDRVASTNYSQPGDDPLRFARIGPDKIIQSTQQVVRPGPDAKVGTDDDITRLAAGESGQAEFLVEGLQEGLHVMNLDLTADLEGLAAGVVKIKGKAAGSVLVRNPKFSMAFSHPRTVRFREPYDASVTVMNTGLTPANLVQVTLHRTAIDGAIFEGDQQETVALGTILPGETVTATYHLRSQRTGRITFSNLTTGDDSVQGRFRLRMGVDERNVALSPDTIAMPDFVTNLPPAVVNAAQRVLGQALSAATAAQLPPGVLRTPRSVITTRVLELAEAGQRLRYHDGLHRVLPDLLLDWQGGRNYNAAFDQIMRETSAGREWRAALMAEIERTNSLHATQRLEDRAADLAGLGQAFVLASASDGRTTIVFGDGKQDAVPESSTQPRALVYDGARGDWGVTPNDSNAVVTWSFTNGTPNAELAVLFVQTNGTARELRWTVTNPPPFAAYRYALADASGQLMVDFDSDGVADTQLPASFRTVVQAPLSLLAVEQDLTVNAGRPRDASRCTGPSWENYGTVVAVMFSRPVNQATAGNPASYVLRYGNGANSVQIQPSGRVALINLRQGISAIRPQALTLTGITDSCGAQMGDCTRDIVSIVPGSSPTEQFKQGVTVRGRVVRGDGRVATNVPVTLTMYDQAFNEFDASCESRPVRMSQVFTDSGGEFEFEFVMAGIPYSISATDTSDLSSEVVSLILQAAARDDINRALLLQLANSPENQNTLLQAFAVAALPQAIAKVEGLDRAILHDFIPAGSSRQGQTMPMVLRFRGRATVTGQVVAEDGFTPVPGAAVNLFPDPDSREQGRGIFADSDGKFAFFGVPLGVFTVDVKTSDRRSRIVAGLLNLPGQITNIVVALPRIGEVTARTTLRGRVFEPDGVTGHAGARVFVGQYGGGSQVAGVVAIVTADATGFWDAPNVPVPQSPYTTYDVVAVSFDGRSKGVRQGITTAANGVSFVNVTLESTGVVIGRVLTSLGEPVENAIVGGGEVLVRTTNDGSFRLTGVPLGRRSFSAVVERSRTNEPPRSNPAFAFPRSGSTSIDVVGGVENFVTIQLNAAGRISGRVFNANGELVKNGVRVAIPREGGFMWTEADTNGVYVFENLGLGSYTLSAPANAVFQTDTSGLIQQIRQGGEEDIWAAIQEAFNIFTGVTDPFLTGQHLNFNPETWGFTRVNLRFDGDNPPNTDIRYLAAGTVAGKVLNHQGVSIGARVRLTGVGPRPNGDVGWIIRGEVNSDPATGVFLFDGIVLEGSYGLQAASPFYSVVITASGQIRQDFRFATNILQFPAPPPPPPPGSSIVSTGWLAGVVLNPDGSQVGAGVTVSVSGVEPTTDTNGEFQVGTALNVGTYAVEALDGVRRGRAFVDVQANITNRVTVRLLGNGGLRIQVVRSTGLPATNAAVDLERGTFPTERITGLRTDAHGEILLQNLVEGSYAVCARASEGATNVFGRAGVIVANDAMTNVAVRLSATGIIEGRFVKRDRTNGIPDAQVAIGSIGYAPTRADGSFRIEGVPPGQYRLVTSDPVTGVGAVGSVIVVVNQTNRITLVEQSRGEVNGRVLGTYRDGFVAGAEVVLSVSDGLTPSRTVTTGPEGSFSFPGTPAGTFHITATYRYKDLQLSGSTQGTLPEDTASVTVQIDTEPLGILPVTVLRSNGALATNVHVTLSSPLLGSKTPGTDTDAQGAVLFPDLRLGAYSITAVDNANGRNAVRTNAMLTVGGTNQTAEVVLPGVGTIEGIVYDSSGQVPQRNLPVTLSIEAPLFAGTTVIHSSSAEGRFTFTDVPVSRFRLSVATNALFATFNGEIKADGQTTNVALRLSDSGSIVGTLVRSNAVTPVPGVDVVLNFNGSNGASGVAVSRTGTNGAFRFDAIPVGRFSVEVNAFAGGGLAKTNAIISFNGQVVDLGRLVLDEDFPSVVQIIPSPATTNVSTSTSVDLLFSEPLDPASLTDPTGIFLRAVGTTVNVPVRYPLLPDASDTRRVRLTPTASLISEQAYEVVVLRSDLVGPGSQLLARAPMDKVGRTLTSLFLSRFTTADNDPPLLVSMFPNTNAIQIDPRAVVRLSFNEPIRGSNFVATLTGANGPVAGVASVGLDGLILNFTPESPLSVNTTYRLAVSNVFDLAGNRAMGEPFTNSFTTLDTLGPVIASIQVVSNSPVAGATVVVEARLATNEPNVTVRFIQDFDFLQPIGYDTNAPYHATVRLPMSGSTTIHAIATDRFGNDGPLATNVISVVSNSPPTVTLARLNPASGSLTNGQSFSITISATDDVGVTNVFVVGAGPGFSFQTNFISVGVQALTQSITSTVPATIAPGSQINFTARATDVFGLASEERSVSYSIVDGAPPVVQIHYPTNTSLLTSNVIEIVVSSSDNSGNHTLELNLSGAVSASQSLSVIAAPNVMVTNRFTNSLAGALTDGTPLRVTLTARDAANLTTVVTQTLAIASGPEIVVQPQGRHTGLGSNATFSVVSFGTALLSFQWRRSGVALAGATNDALRLNSVGVSDLGQYSVVVSNVFGVATSANAPLEFSTNSPLILLQPQSVFSGVGATVRFSAQVVLQEQGRYQWVFFSTNLSVGVDLPGATGPLLTLTNVGSTNVGAYQLRVTDDFGTVLSDKAWLILTNNVDGLALNTTLAHPPVAMMLIGDALPAGLVLNTTLAQPPVMLSLLGTDNTGGLELNTTAAQPPVSVFLLGMDNTGGLALNTTAAQPPVSVFLLGTDNTGGLVLNTTAAQPPVSLFLLGTDNTGGLALNTSVAQPPVSVFLLGTDNTSGLAFNTTLAQPPVIVVIETNGVAFAAADLAPNIIGLSFSPAGKELSIRWNNPGVVLQSSTNLTVWADVPNAASPYLVPLSRRGSEFFRLRLSANETR